MSNITSTTNPNVNLIANRCPPTADHVCFWSTDHEAYAQIKTTAIREVVKNYATGYRYLLINNPSSVKESRLNIKEVAYLVGNTLKRSKKLASIRSNYHG